MGEIIHLHIGQCGIQLGSALWEQYIPEHGIEPDGTLSTAKSLKKDENKLDRLFYETKDGKYHARSLFGDADSFVIDSVKKGENKQIFNPNYLLCDKEQSGCLARSSHRYAGKFDEEFMEKLRKLSESCENPQGYIVTHSVCGGFGAGYTSRILTKMSDLYPKKHKVSYSMFPSPNLSNLVVEPYNMILTMWALKDHADLSILFDNEALYKICSNQMDNESPNYADINKMVARALSTSFSSTRFNSSINSNLGEIITNLVPYPEIHFAMPSYAPFGDQGAPFSVEDITKTAFNPVRAKKSFLRSGDINLNLFCPQGVKQESVMLSSNLKLDKEIACCVTYRGRVDPETAVNTVNNLKNVKELKTVDWCSTGFKTGITYQDPVSSKIPSEVGVLINSANFAKILEREAWKFDQLYWKRAFCHWYIGDGLDEGAFSEAREILGHLKKDYEEINHLSEENDENN